MVTAIISCANQSSELNSVSNWYETPFRGYDASIGRFMQIDPVANKYASLSPYNYAFNSPVLLNDPTGADPGLAQFLLDLFNTSYHGQTYSEADILAKMNNYEPIYFADGTNALLPTEWILKIPREHLLSMA